MGWGTGNLGGGSGGLNFKIVSYATESELLADTPKENTIGVITSIPITGYHFGREEPSPAAAGMVWITTGTSSTVEFNALKKNGIQVYPISTKQYIGDVWVNKAAKSYQGGEWVKWTISLYENGDEFADITGGWIMKTEPNGIATKKIDHIALSCTGITMTGAVAYTAKKIDVTNCNTLVFDLSAARGGANFGWVAGLTSAPNAGDGWTYHNGGSVNHVAAIGTTSSVNRMEMTLDVSGVSGLYYVEVASVDGSLNFYGVTLR